MTLAWDLHDPCMITSSRDEFIAIQLRDFTTLSNELNWPGLHRSVSTEERPASRKDDVEIQDAMTRRVFR
jgi:hypothetical protein